MEIIHACLADTYYFVPVSLDEFLQLLNALHRRVRR